MPDFRALVRQKIGHLAVDPAREGEIVEELAQQPTAVPTGSVLYGGWHDVRYACRLLRVDPNVALRTE